MTEELKPCPFCGSKSKIFSGFDRYMVVCSNDNCILNTAYKSEQEACAAWNTRTLTPAQEHAEELYEGLSTMLNVTGDICEALTPLFYDLQGSLKDEPQRWQKLIEEIEAQEAQP